MVSLEVFQILGRLRRNVGILITANVLTTALGIVSVSLNARALGPGMFGIFVLIQAYVAIFGRVFVLDTWQAIATLGGDAIAKQEQARFSAVCLIALVFDTLTGLVAVGIGTLILAQAGTWVGLPEQYQELTALWMLALLVHFSSAPAGILRATQRFASLATTDVAEAALKALAAGVLYAGGAALPSYVYAYAALAAAVSLSRLGLSMMALNRHGALKEGFHSLGRTLILRFARFSIGASLSRIINVARNYGVLFAVSFFHGSDGAGLFAIAQRLVTPIAFISEPIRQALYPEFSAAKARGFHDSVPLLVRKIVLVTIPLAVGIVFAAVLLGEWALILLAGPEFAGAYPILIAATASASLYLCVAFVGPLTIIYIGMRSYLISNFMAAGGWLVALLILLAMLGPVGGALAEGLFVALWATLNLLSLERTRSIFR